MSPREPMAWITMDSLVGKVEVGEGAAIEGVWWGSWLGWASSRMGLKRRERFSSLPSRLMFKRPSSSCDSVLGFHTLFRLGNRHVK